MPTCSLGGSRLITGALFVLAHSTTDLYHGSDNKAALSPSSAETITSTGLVGRPASSQKQQKSSILLALNSTNIRLCSVLQCDSITLARLNFYKVLHLYCLIDVQAKLYSTIMSKDTKAQTEKRLQIENK